MTIRHLARFISYGFLVGMIAGSSALWAQPEEAEDTFLRIEAMINRMDVIEADQQKILTRQTQAIAEIKKLKIWTNKRR